MRLELRPNCFTDMSQAYPFEKTFENYGSQSYNGLTVKTFLFRSSRSDVQQRWKRTYYGHFLIISNIILTNFVLFCLLGYYSCGYRYSSTAFLFSLVNKPGWGPIKFSSPGRYNRYHTYSCSSYGPTFGGGHDIHIANYRSGSYSNLGYSYQPPAGQRYGSSFTQSFLAGSYSFVPDEVEVFYETT